MFQSLLWRICHFDPFSKSWRPAWLEFQSLLWRICHFDNFQSSSLHSGSYCFNPCYDGFVILTQKMCMKIGNAHVSILVMTDLSFWLKQFSQDPHDSWCFNPCYDGFVILTLFEVRKMTKYKSFNPCYDGFVILTLEGEIKSLNGSLFQSLLWRICHFDVHTQCFPSFSCVVSILVMTDLSFWRKNYFSMSRIAKYVSILVMTDLSFWL